jgi:excisionase family DNA binding protein
MHPQSSNSKTQKIVAERRAFRVDEAASLLGVSRATLYKLAADGRIRLVKIGGRTLVPASEIERVAEAGA